MHIARARRTPGERYASVSAKAFHQKHHVTVLEGPPVLSRPGRRADRSEQVWDVSRGKVRSNTSLALSSFNQLSPAGEQELLERFRQRQALSLSNRETLPRQFDAALDGEAKPLPTGRRRQSSSQMGSPGFPSTLLNRANQSVFGPEMSIEGRWPDTCGGDDVSHADIGTALGKQQLRRVKKSFSVGLSVSAHACLAVWAGISSTDAQTARDQDTCRAD